MRFIFVLLHNMVLLVCNESGYNVRNEVNQRTLLKEQGLPLLVNWQIMFHQNSGLTCMKMA